MATSKIRIKIGQVEVDFEGSEQFLKKDLPDLLESLTKLHEQTGGEIDPSNGSETKTNKPGKFVGTTATLAGKLKSKSAGDLIIAAAAQLTLVEGKSEFARKELHDSVKGASGYYKETVSKNFTNYLNARVKAGDLMEPKNGHYSLSAEKKQQLESALA